MARTEKRTYRDRRQYLIRAVKARRRKVRAMAVAYKGGQCELCGYDRSIDVFEFHHRDGSQKDFGISEKGYARSWARVRSELDKCQLLCSNCHRETHAKLAASTGNRS
jgi:predicted HNH restriction endonuclease